MAGSELSELKSSVAAVQASIEAMWDRRRAAVSALCAQYAGYALQNFRMKQAQSAFWTNRTGIAQDTVFSGVISERAVAGFFLAHAVEYGVYLELANDRRHQSLLPIVSGLYARFKRDLEEVLGAA